MTVAGDYPFQSWSDPSRMVSSRVTVPAVSTVHRDKASFEK